MAIPARDTRLAAGRRVFTHILVGIDGSEHALEAARQAALLCDVDGRLTILTVWDTATTLIGGTGSHVPPYYDEELQHGTAEKAVAAARDYVAPYSAATAKVVRGSAFGELLEEIRRDQDTLEPTPLAWSSPYDLAASAGPLGVFGCGLVSAGVSMSVKQRATAPRTLCMPRLRSTRPSKPQNVRWASR